MEDWRKIDYGAFQKRRMVQGRQAVYCFSSFNACMHLMVKLGTVPINFVQSMRLNIDVVGKKRKVEQDRRTCIWPDIEVLDSSPTIHHFTLDYPTAIVGGHPISPSTTGGSATTHPSTLTFNLFHFEKIRREDFNIEYSAFRLYDSHSLYRVLAFVLGIFLESGWV